MRDQLDRRRVLRGSLVVTAAVGLGSLGAAPSAAAKPGSPTCGAPVPDVPGMGGDPKANQFWYQYDEDFLFHPSQEIAEAFAACQAYLGTFDAFVDQWWQEREKPGYPRDFITLVEPIAGPLRVISQGQLGIIDKYFWCDPRGLVSAFVDCGQGVLYDPRRPEGIKVHMMSSTTGAFPKAWHRWHVVIRAMTVLGIDAGRWLRIDPLVALGWATQVVAQPVIDARNPRLDRRTIKRLERFWLTRRPEQLDQAFEHFPSPPYGAG